MWILIFESSLLEHFLLFYHKFSFWILIIFGFFSICLTEKKNKRKFIPSRETCSDLIIVCFFSTRTLSSGHHGMLSKTGLLCEDTFPLCEDRGSVGLVLLEVVWIHAENVLFISLSDPEIRYMSICVYMYVHVHEHTYMNPLFSTCIDLIDILESLLSVWDFAAFWLWFCHSWDLCFHMWADVCQMTTPMLVSKNCNKYFEGKP